LLDEEWRNWRFEADDANKQINAIGRNSLRLQSKNCSIPLEAQALKAEKDNWTKVKTERNSIADEKEKDLFKSLKLIGNIVHANVPDSLNEDDNVVIHKWWPEGRSEEEDRAKKALVKKWQGQTWVHVS